MGIAQDYLAGAEGGAAAQDAARKAAVYNALAHVYGPGAGAVQTQDADIGYKNALAGNAKSETAERDTLLPGRVADQTSQQAYRNAQTQTVTQGNAADLIHQHATAANAMLSPDGSNAEQVWQNFAPKLKTDLGLSDDDLQHEHDVFTKDPHGQIARVLGLTPKPGVGIQHGNYINTTENPLTGQVDPAQNPSGVSPAVASEGAPQYFIDGAGKNHSITFDKFGGARENGQSIGQLPSDWKPLRQEQINIGQQRADTGDAALAERKRADQAREAAAQQRIAIAVRNSAPLDDQTKDYLSDQVRQGRTDVLSRLNSAQRVMIYQDAADKAAAEGATGESDAMNAQKYKARQVALDDMTKSTPNSMGGKIQSAGTLLNHLDTLTGIVGDLQSSNIQIKNAAQQRFKAEFGKAPPVEFNAQKTIVGDELARLLIANGGAAKDRAALIDEPLSRANSPAQLNAVGALLKEDIKQRMLPARTLSQAIGLDGEFDKRSSPALKALLGTNPPPPPNTTGFTNPRQAAPDNGGWGNFRVH